MSTRSGGHIRNEVDKAYNVDKIVDVYEINEIGEIILQGHLGQRDRRG